MHDEPVEDRTADLGVWPANRPSPWAGPGIVPICTPVLHRPAQPITKIDDRIVALAEYMVGIMTARHGIGLAANQVGVNLRMFVHALPRVAPPVLINPTVISSSGRWGYPEACLSVRIDGTRARLDRPKRLHVTATLLDGADVEIEADELLARVFQHEIDHLDGIEYVQRLGKDERRRVYATMAQAGVDTTWVQPLSRGTRTWA